jgi:hypothetical protein
MSHRTAAQVLAAIADAYDKNALDDEARKFWGPPPDYNAHTNQTPPDDIILYTGRGGVELLTLGDCLRAREELKSSTAPRRQSALSRLADDLLQKQAAARRAAGVPGVHEWRTDGQHQNEFCRFCLTPRPVHIEGQPQDDYHLPCDKVVRHVRQLRLGRGAWCRCRKGRFAPPISRRAWTRAGLYLGALHKETSIEQRRRVRCSGCAAEIDEVVCCCGSPPDSHNGAENHAFVPMGCICARLSAPLPPGLLFTDAERVLAIIRDQALPPYLIPGKKPG